MMQGESASIISFINIPVSIILGVVIGLALGYFQLMELGATTCSLLQMQSVRLVRLMDQDAVREMQ